MRGFNAFAELVSVPESLLVRESAGLTLGQAAAVPLAASTGLQVGATTDASTLAATWPSALDSHCATPAATGRFAG